MNPAEALQLCRLVKAICPSQAMDEYTPDAWAAILDDQPYVTATEAVRNLARLPLEPGKARYIEPGHIIGEIRRINNRRIQTAALGSPPAGLSTVEYLEWLNTERDRAIAGLCAKELES